MKAKKWARKARTIVVHLEGRDGADLSGVHVIEVRDSHKKTVRKRVVEYHNQRPSVSALMLDVQARLAKNALVVEPDSYYFADSGRTLRARVRLRAASEHPSS